MERFMLVFLNVFDLGNRCLQVDACWFSWHGVGATISFQEVSHERLLDKWGFLCGGI